MQDTEMLDHLFRHQYGKMVSILTKIFGLSNLELVEDAVQDTFINAMKTWQVKLPENPEAWLTAAAKNRAIDLLKKVKSENERFEKLPFGEGAMAFDELFLDHEISDGQLRMIFVACHPALNPKDQIAFALKTIAGFSAREIATALLTKEESIKKRLVRARKSIAENNISFEFPSKHEIPKRLSQVLDVIYLIFNEGFHSGKQDMLVRKDLCGEALRLIQLVLKKELFRCGEAYALFGLMCFHAARIDSKISDNDELLDLSKQNRKLWYFPLIQLGNSALEKAMEYEGLTPYHIEAAIASEHLKSPSLEQTDWAEILGFYYQLQALAPSDINLVNIAFVHLQLDNLDAAKKTLELISISALEQRAYLYFGTWAVYYESTQDYSSAIAFYDKALERVTNAAEKKYMTDNKNLLLNKMN